MVAWRQGKHRHHRRGRERQVERRGLRCHRALRHHRRHRLGGDRRLVETGVAAGRRLEPHSRHLLARSSGGERCQPVGVDSGVRSGGDVRRARACRAGRRDIEPCDIEPCAIEPCAIEPCAIEPCAIEPCAIEPCAIEACAIEIRGIDPLSREQPCGPPRPFAKASTKRRS
jgi:hypothetical protein